MAPAPSAKTKVPTTIASNMTARLLSRRDCDANQGKLTSAQARPRFQAGSLAAELMPTLRATGDADKREVRCRSRRGIDIGSTTKPATGTRRGSADRRTWKIAPLHARN